MGKQALPSPCTSVSLLTAGQTQRGRPLPQDTQGRVAVAKLNLVSHARPGLLPCTRICFGQLVPISVTHRTQEMGGFTVLPLSGSRISQSPNLA